MIVIQRFGGALNLNVHLHALILDGVLVPTQDGRMIFQPVPHLTTLDVEEVLATIEPHLARRLARRGPGGGDEAGAVPDAWLDEAPVLAGLAAASFRACRRWRRGAQPGSDRSRSGPSRGRRGPVTHVPTGVQFSGAWGPTPTPACSSASLVARAAGALHAALVVPAGQRERLEQVCRYVLRPPVAAERLQVTAEGQVRVTFRQPWRDGTTAIVFDPVEFLGRLAVLIPRPRINLLLYYGVLGARARDRAQVVRHSEAAPATDDDRLTKDHDVARGGPSVRDARARARGQQWAALMRRTFGFDVLACPRCGGRLRLIALIEQGPVVARVLGHLGLPIEIPPPSPARAPPAIGPVDAADGWDEVVVS